MDEQTALIEQLRQRLASLGQDRIDGLVRETWLEATAEARAILKAMMVRSILKGALTELDSRTAGASPSEEPEPTAEPENAEPAPAAGKAAAPSQEAEEGYGYYVYGIVANDESLLNDRLPAAGIDPACPVEPMPHNGLCAVVSRVSLGEFGSESLERNLNDLEWLEAKVRAHQDVLALVAAGGAVIPLRFGAIYRSEEGVRAMLAEGQEAFVGLLAGFAGRTEWGVRICFDRARLTERVAEISESVRALQAELATQSSGRAHFSKKKLDRAILEETERVRDECAQASHERLASHGDRAVINPLQSRELTGRTDEMILNGAYLVADRQSAAFRAAFEELKETYGDLGFSYEMTGPWPPYNFVAPPGEGD